MSTLPTPLHKPPEAVQKILDQLEQILVKDHCSVKAALEQAFDLGYIAGEVAGAKGIADLLTDRTKFSAQ